jgi:CheY-like chemotaxis protein
MRLLLLEIRKIIIPDVLRILIVEDNPDDTELMVVQLTGAGFQVDWHRVETEASFLDALSERLEYLP